MNIINVSIKKIILSIVVLNLSMLTCSTFISARGGGGRHGGGHGGGGGRHGGSFHGGGGRRGGFGWGGGWGVPFVGGVVTGGLLGSGYNNYYQSNPDVVYVSDPTPIPVQRTDYIYVKKNPASSAPVPEQSSDVENKLINLENQIAELSKEQQILAQENEALKLKK